MKALTISDYNGNVPDNISRIIKDRGYKQSAIAKKAGLDDHQFTAMLKGRRIIKVSDIVAISAALGVKVSDMFADSSCNSGPGRRRGRE